MTLQVHLHKLGVDLVTLFEQLEEPAALVDVAGVVLWQNAAGIAFVGDQRGVNFSAIAPDYLQNARAALSRKRAGQDPVSSSSVVLIDTQGRRRRVETVSISLKRGDTVVAVLGIVRKILNGPAERSEHQLTPRQEQTLRLLAAGLTTEEIAQELSVARETARNYIRRLLQALGVHSRLEAVVRAREIGLL